MQSVTDFFRTIPILAILVITAWPLAASIGGVVAACKMYRQSRTLMAAYPAVLSLAFGALFVIMTAGAIASR